MPTEGYVLNKTESYCIKGNDKDTKIKEMIDYNNDSQTLSVSKLTDNNTKCYLYFDKQTASEKTLADLGLEKSKEGCPTIEDGQTIVTDIEGTRSLMCSAEDNDGESFYFRGTTNNNWVKFGQTKSNEDIWWRIIRINGDGTIRLIYAGKGTSAPSNNGGNAIESQVYNSTHNDNTYVGFYNKNGTTSAYPDAHEGTNPSNIANQLNNWFTITTKLSTEYISHIDENAGYCNDRRKSIVNHGNTNFTNEGFGGKSTWYAPFDRVAESATSSNYSSTEQKPTLKCGDTIDDETYKRDYFTWQNKSDRGNQKLENPVGLITMDEVILAGGFGAKSNKNYWLNSGSEYWTISPNLYNGDISVFYVQTGGNLYAGNGAYPRGIRPVINLKANILFEPSNEQAEWGTKENPYIVNVN